MNVESKYSTALWAHCFILGLLSLSFCSRAPANSEPYAKVGTTIAGIVANRTLSRIGQPKSEKLIGGIYDCETLPVSRNSLTLEFDCEWYIRAVEMPTQTEGESDAEEE